MPLLIKREDKSGKPNCDEFYIRGKSKSGKNQLVKLESNEELSQLDFKINKELSLFYHRKKIRVSLAENKKIYIEILRKEGHATSNLPWVIERYIHDQEMNQYLENNFPLLPLVIAAFPLNPLIAPGDWVNHIQKQLKLDLKNINYVVVTNPDGLAFISAKLQNKQFGEITQELISQYEANANQKMLNGFCEQTPEDFVNFIKKDVSNIEKGIAILMSLYDEMLKVNAVSVLEAIEITYICMQNEEYSDTGYFGGSELKDSHVKILEEKFLGVLKILLNNSDNLSEIKQIVNQSKLMEHNSYFGDNKAQQLLEEYLMNNSLTTRDRSGKK